MGTKRVPVRLQVRRRKTPPIRRPPKQPLPRPAGDTPAAAPGPAGKQQ
jgi:hypothetical protein